MLRVSAAVGALLLSASAWGAPLPANPGGLKEVPAAAPLVVHLRGVEGTADRLFTLVGQVEPKAEGMLRQEFAKFMEKGERGRKLRGLAKDGPIFVAFTEMPKVGNEPKLAVIAAVTNYAAFRDNLLTEEERKALKKDDAGVETTTLDGKPVWFIDRRGYAVVTPNKEVAGVLARRGAGLDTRISKELGGRLAAADLGVYVSMDVFNKDYAKQIKEARETIDGFLKLTLEVVPKEQRAGLEMVQKAVGPTFQAVEDSQGLLLAIELRPAGLNLHAQTELRAGTATARALRETKVSAFKDLGHLPAGQMVYTGVQTSPAVIQAVGGLLFGALVEADSDAAKKVQTAIDGLVKAGPGTRLECSALPLQGLQAWSYEKPAEAAAAQLKLFQGLAAGATFQQGQLKEKPEIKKNAQKYDGFEFHSVKLVWDVEKMLAGQGAALPEEAQKKMLEALKTILGESVTVWFGATDKQLIQVTARDWETARKLLDGYLKQEGGIGPKGNFKEVRQELPAEATFLVVVDLAKYAFVILRLTRPFLEDQFAPLKNLPAAAPEGKPSFVGLAVGLHPDRGGLNLYLSTAAIKDAYQSIAKPLMGQKEARQR
jgi:hypothetical protein